MSIFDKARRKARESLGDHPDKVGKGIDKIADKLDERTGGKYTDKIDRGTATAKKRASEYGRTEEPPAQR